MLVFASRDYRSLYNKETHSQNCVSRKSKPDQSSFESQISAILPCTTSPRPLVPLHHVSSARLVLHFSSQRGTALCPEDFATWKTWPPPMAPPTSREARSAREVTCRSGLPRPWRGGETTVRGGTGRCFPCGWTRGKNEKRYFVWGPLGLG